MECSDSWAVYIVGRTSDSVSVVSVYRPVILPRLQTVIHSDHVRQLVAKNVQSADYTAD